MSEVTIGRLKRKIQKLQKQRDYYQKENQLLNRMIEMYPHIRHTWKQYEERKQELAQLSSLKARINEQELLIRILTKDTTLQNFDIARAYNEVVKSEMRRINE